MELTSRHRITGVEWDGEQRAVALSIEITDPATARPIDVRFDVLEAGVDSGAPTGVRSKKIGTIARDGKSFDVLGTYLGVVADEN
jgi:hypothetical protein